MESGSDSVDLYEILGLEKSAGKSEIKKAYHRAALSSHPDKVPESERADAEIKFKSVSQAYEILYDDEKRELYDQYGMSAFERGGGNGGGADMDDFMEQMFSAMGGMGGMGGMPGMGRRPNRPTRGADEQQIYEITLEELYKGKTTRFASTKNKICGHCKGTGGKDKAKAKTCDTCQGSGMQTRLRRVGAGLVTQETVNCSVCNGAGQFFKEKERCKRCKGARTVEEKKLLELYIPPGSRQGDRIVLEGEGDQHPDQKPGNIVFVLKEVEHDVLTRAGPDLAADVTISLIESLTGFSKVVLTHLDGRKIKITTPKGTILRPEQVLKVDGEGMPIKRSAERGDLYLIIKVEYPEDGAFDDAAIAKLRDVLPKPESGLSEDGELDEVEFVDGDLEDFGAASDDPRAGAQWEDEDEEPQTAQCAQQ